MNDIFIRNALRKRFSDHRRYAMAEEVGLTTGYSHRRLDVMILDCFWSNGFRIDGFEIKISTSDLRRELEDPEKHIAFFDVIDYYTLAVPKGVVEPLTDIIPKKWGIMIINEDGSTRYKRKPLALNDAKSDRSVSRGFLASITRSIQSLQPSEQELLAKYDQGFKEGKKRAEEHMASEMHRIQRNANDLADYEKLKIRFRLWGDDIDKILDEFEAFRKLNIDFMIREAGQICQTLTEFKNFLEQRKEENARSRQSDSEAQPMPLMHGKEGQNEI